MHAALGEANAQAEGGRPASPCTLPPSTLQPGLGAGAWTEPVSWTRLDASEMLRECLSFRAFRFLILWTGWT